MRQESLAIDANFEKKRKQADTALKMYMFQSTQILSCAHFASPLFDDSSQSTSTNKSRLRVLQAREQLLQDLFSEARIKISDLPTDEGRYTQLLEGIVVEVRHYICRVSPSALMPVALSRQCYEFLSPRLPYLYENRTRHRRRPQSIMLQGNIRRLADGT